MKNIEFLKKSLIIHRGKISNNVEENTIPAFVKCVDKNFEIELDIHILTDKTIVIYHDFNLKRLIGVNKIIESLSYAQLSKYRINKKYQIPTLKQVMHIVDGKVPLLIDIKDISNNNNLEKELVKLLDNYNGKFALQSINPKVIDWFYKNRPDYVIGLILFNEINYKLLKKCIKKVDFISINKRELPFKNKKMIIGWTINNKQELNKYISISDNLICEKIL